MQLCFCIVEQTTGDISNSGSTLSFPDPIPIVQNYIDELEAKGIKRIIALGHNGYGPDMELAAKTRGLDLIVGGHSHSYLGDPQNPLYQGPFPTIIKSLDAENTLIVQVMVLLPKKYLQSTLILSNICVGVLPGQIHRKP